MISDIKNGIITDTAHEDGTAYSTLPYSRFTVVSSFGEGSEAVTEVWLPDEWNGIYVGLGNGGLAGRIGYEELASYVRRGYAVAQTDMGTRDGRARGTEFCEVHKDFGWRATHEMTVIAKTLIKAHYGREAKYSYFCGSSTGGQQALSEAQRFPLDYDGIVAGVPANNRVFLHTYFLWTHNHLVKNGKPLFTAEQVGALTSYGTQYFQSKGDGERGDNFITFPWIDENTVEGYITFLRSKKEFTEEQLEALTAIYDGPTDPESGRRIYNGMPIGSEKYGCGIMDCQVKESPHFYPFPWTFGADYNADGFNFGSDLEKVSDKLSRELNANKTDLSAFKANGGKLLAFSGSADPCVPYQDAINYYERAVKANGGYEKTAEFFRYFLLPGRDHGGGGDGINAFFQSHMLEYLRRWRENGEAPDGIECARVENGEKVWSRTVYNYLSEKFPKRELPPGCCEYYLIK